MPACLSSHEFWFIQTEVISRKLRTEIVYYPRRTKLWIWTRNWEMQHLQTEANGNGPSQGRRQMGVARACSSTLMAKGCFSTGFSTNIVIANVVRKLFLQLVLKDNRVIDLLWNHGFFVRPPACDSRCPLVLKRSLAPRPALLCPALPTPLANWPLTSFTQQEPPTGPASPTRRPSTPGSQLQSGSPHPGDFDTISCDVPPAQEVAVACRY